mmetsp:Transcript_47776/g.86053  ORF Transcript_47776/g.86053 Transcript_47776/m.86053 type:complete len:107 (+) Transcript_47776:126-446(+)
MGASQTACQRQCCKAIEDEEVDMKSISSKQEEAEKQRALVARFSAAFAMNYASSEELSKMVFVGWKQLTDISKADEKARVAAVKTKRPPTLEEELDDSAWDYLRGE